MSRARDLADAGSKANFLDNVSADINTTYAPKASPIFTGTVTSPIVQTDSIKDDSGTRILASDSGSAWSWGSGLPSGSIVQVQYTQFDTGAVHSSMSSNVDYVLQNSTSITSGGGVSGILDVNITPKITGSKIWLTSHIFGEANLDNVWDTCFFFWRSVGSTHTKLKSGVTGKNIGATGISMATRTYDQPDADSTPEILNMQYFDTHGVNAGTQITYKVGITKQGVASEWYTNRTVVSNASTEAGVSSICAIELAP